MYLLWSMMKLRDQDEAMGPGHSLGVPSHEATIITNLWFGFDVLVRSSDGTGYTQPDHDKGREEDCQAQQQARQTRLS